MRSLILALALTLFAANAADAKKRAIVESWGKPGVSFDTYRADALECGRLGYYADISGTEAAQAFVRGSRELDAATESHIGTVPGADPVDEAVVYANRLERIRAGVQPDRREREIRDFMQDRVDRCLVKRGYVKFRLTDAQRKHIGKLATGTPDRHAYLFSLASSPEVLSRQTKADSTAR